jgi:BolA protein
MNRENHPIADQEPHESCSARIRRKLTVAFAPNILEINDNSSKHVGHAGHNPLGESHFDILIVSAAFEKMSILARHRAVYRVLADELKERVHALSLQTLTNDEHTHR